MILSGCASSVKKDPPIVALKEHEVSAVSDHTQRIQAYQAWLTQANKQLQEQQAALKTIIEETKSVSHKTIVAAEHQHRLLNEMNSMDINFLKLQSATQQSTRTYNIISNMLKAQLETSKEIIKNMK